MTIIETTPNDINFNVKLHGLWTLWIHTSNNIKMLYHKFQNTGIHSLQ